VINLVVQPLIMLVKVAHWRFETYFRPGVLALCSISSLYMYPFVSFPPSVSPCHLLRNLSIEASGENGIYVHRGRPQSDGPYGVCSIPSSQPCQHFQLSFSATSLTRRARLLQRPITRSRQCLTVRRLRPAKHPKMNISSTLASGCCSTS
jgi:hypothetical protein